MPSDSWLEIKIRVFGPEITRLVGREQVIELDADSTVEDLAQKLEVEVKAKHGWAPNFLRSNFTILVNGIPAENLCDRTLKDGGLVVLLSPVGGG